MNVMLSMTTTDSLSDWNASDAERGAGRPGLLERVALPAVKTRARRALREVSARPVEPGDHPRATNIVAGLAPRVGGGPAELWVYEGDGPNALTCRLDRIVIATARSLLESYTRTEIEAVIAHCLVRSRTAGRKGVRIGYADDVRAAALTRYPPALAAALRKAQPYQGKFASFYMVAEGPTHRPVEERALALLDL